MTHDSYDILVIGAGPAGSFAARHTAAAGWDHAYGLPRQTFDRLLWPEALAGAQSLGRPQGALLRPALSHKLSADRLLWVGDGAGLTYQQTGQGLSYALESGRQAARTADLALRAERFDGERLRAYDDWIHARFSRELLGWGPARSVPTSLETT